MRTTLTLDPDVTLRIKERLENDPSLSLKDLVNSGLRLGLSQLPSASPTTYKVLTHPLGLRPGFDPDKLNQLLDDLEVEDRLARLHADS